jgi:hypothetical protein
MDYWIAKVMQLTGSKDTQPGVGVILGIPYKSNVRFMIKAETTVGVSPTTFHNPYYKPKGFLRATRPFNTEVKTVSGAFMPVDKRFFPKQGPECSEREIKLGSMDEETYLYQQFMKKYDIAENSCTPWSIRLQYEQFAATQLSAYGRVIQYPQAFTD